MVSGPTHRKPRHAAPLPPSLPRRHARSVVLASSLLADAGPATPEPAPHPYLGIWVTDDGHIRHELLANGRYDGARGRRQSAYRGRYAIAGHRIDYVDDTGFSADGGFVDGVLYHAGMVLRREWPAIAPRDDD